MQMTFEIRSLINSEFVLKDISVSEQTKGVFHFEITAALTTAKESLSPWTRKYAASINSNLNITFRGVYVK